MKRINVFIVLFIAIFLGSIFMLTGCGKTKSPLASSLEPSAEHYTCGMHPSVKVSVEEYNKGNKTCPICNMNLTPVYKEGKEETASSKGEILFYRNPMNPAITSSVPAKDEMGMDYIPVYKEDDAGEYYYGCGMHGAEHVFIIREAQGIKICPMCGMPLEKLTKEEAGKLKGVISKVKIKGDEAVLAGVKTEPVEKKNLLKEIRTVGKVAYDPELAIAQEEFIAGLNALDRIKKGDIKEISERASSLVESSRRKLRLLGLSEEQIKDLEKKREVETNLILPEKKMWIYGDAYEYELSWIKKGAEVIVTASTLPGEEFLGVISSINPVLDPKTRAVRFRAEVDNPGLHLKPEMFADVVIKSVYSDKTGAEKVLAVPKEAVLDTGTRKIVWVAKGNNEYEGRMVEVGPEASVKDEKQNRKFYPVFAGLKEGESVVTRANFLIDSQSQISGVAASAYSGAVSGENKSSLPAHQH